MTSSPTRPARRAGSPSCCRCSVKNRIKLGLSGFDYYTWAGIEDKNGLAFDFSGLERFTNGVFTAKPALGVFRRGVLRMEGCRSKGVLATVCLH